MAASGCTEKSLYCPEKKQRKKKSIKIIRKEWLQVAARKSHYIFRRTNNGKVSFFSINFIRKEWLLEASGCKWLHGKVTLFSGEKTTEKFYFFSINFVRKEWLQVAAQKDH